MRIELFCNLFYVFLLIFEIDCLAQITISEVMFDVSTNESHDEFVEIFNLSESDSMDVSGWSFSDSSGVDEIIPYSGSTIIGPRSFAVILDGSYLENSSTYDSVIPDSVVIFTIDDRAFGSSGLSNSKSEFISVINANGDTLSSYRYSVGNKPGFSDEKIILELKNDTTNWKDSKVAGGTPGYKNSVTPPDWDLGFEESSLETPHLLFENDSIQIEVVLINYGIKAVDDTIEIMCFLDKDEDIRYSEKDILIEKNYLYSEQWFERFIIRFNWNYLPAGEHLLVVNLNYPLDQNSENDIISKNITVLMRSSKLYINEIKFLTLEDEPECTLSTKINLRLRF
jgi:archaellum component FlaF (FlaF/FlaG flagellin family)